MFGAALRFLQAPSPARRKNRLSARGTNSDRVLRTKQGDVVGCAAEALPAADTAEAEQGQTQRPRPADETGSCVWRSAPIFTRAHCRPLGKLAKRKRTAVCFLRGRGDARSKSRAPQPGAGRVGSLALCRFLRRAAERACKNRSAAPASARLFRPLDAPGQSCPGPKRSGRSGQKPKKTRRPWPVKTSSAYKRRPGFFLTAFARRSD